MASRIVGTGISIPPVVVTNDDLSRIMDTTDEWIRQRTGIEERHYVEPGVATSDLCVDAARAALDDAGLEPKDIDYLIVATMTPDYFFPGSAPFVQHKLGLDHVPCLDIRQQCAGFVYASQIADSLIASATARTVLVIGGEVHSSLMPWRSWHVAIGDTDEPVPEEEYETNTRTRDRTVLFGDGAGAVVVAAADQPGFIDAVIHTNGSEARRLWTPAAGSAFRPYISQEMIDSGDITPIVEGRRVYALAVTAMPAVTEEVLAKNGMSVEDLDLVIMHQANLRINEGVQKRLGLPDDKVFNNIQRYGNTTAATIPIAFHEARLAGMVSDGDLICFVALGSGLNWGAILYRA
jgi:3-oxoacyl-[acyl-carrier-protein] synthase-3